MKVNFRKLSVLMGMVAGLFVFSGERARAAVITEWSWNAAVAGATSGTSAINSPAPSYGNGTAVTLGMNNSYNGGSESGDDVTATKGTANTTVSEDLWRIRGNTAPVDGSNPSDGWALYNISSGTAHDGAPQFSQGLQLNASTVGYSNISFNFDWYSTTQGIRDLQFQYNLNVSNTAGWTNYGGTTPDMANSGSDSVYIATPNDYYGGASPSAITVNLSSVAAAANDPNFGIRLVSAFDDTGAYQDYVSATLANPSASNPYGTQLYNNSSGNWRFGNLTFQGVLTINTSASGPTINWNTGSGTWDTVTMNWSDSGSNPIPYADGVNNVVFGTITGGSNSLIIVPSGGVSPTGVAISNANASNGYTFSGGAIGGTGALYLTSDNAGTVTLTGSNSYTGGTQISGGTLIIASDSSLGGVTGSGTSAAYGSAVVDNGASLQLSGPMASARLFEVGVNGGVLNTNGFAASTSGSFLGGGSFLLTGGGSLSLNGATIQLSGSTTIASGNTLILSGTNTSSFQGGGTFNGNLLVSSPARVNFDNGVYGGSGQINVSASGTVTKTNASANNDWAVLTNSPQGAATAAGGTVTSAGTINNNIVLNSGNLPFTPSNVAITYSLSTAHTFLVGIGATNGGTLAINGIISGSSDLILGSNSTIGAGGAGTLILGNNNTYKGTTIIDGNGVVQLGVTNALPTTTNVIFGATDTTGATLDLNGNNQTINTLSVSTGAPTVTNSSLTGGTLTISGGTLTKTGYTGFITGNLTLIKNGVNGLTLSASNTYTGATVINAGTVSVSNTSALGVGALNVTGGSLISSGAYVSLANSSASFGSGTGITLGTTSAIGTLALNSLTLANSSSLTYGFTTTQDDTVLGSGALTLSGTHIVINMNQTGTLFSQYPLFQFNSVTGFTASGANATFAMGTGTSAVDTYSFSQNGGVIDLNISGTNVSTFLPLVWAVGSGSWNSTTTGVWNVSNSSYVDGDTVSFPEPSGSNSIVILGKSGTGSVTPSSMTISNSANSYTFSGGPIIGTTSVVKTGAGNATFSSTNGYTGGTFITSGSLTVTAGDLSLGSTTSQVSINSGASLVTATTGITSPRAFNFGAGSTVGTFNTNSLNSTISGATTITAGGTLAVTGGGILSLGTITGTANTVTGSIVSGAGGVINVQSGTLAIVGDAIAKEGTGTSNNIYLNVNSGATMVMSQSVTGNTFEQAFGGTYNGNVVFGGNNPVTLSLAGGFTAGSAGTGTISFQAMQAFAAPTHFTAAYADIISVAGNLNTQEIDNNIVLNSTNQPFNKTSILQVGSGAGGTGFVLGTGNTASSTATQFMDFAPGTGNTLILGGVISGNCDVQFGGIGGGGGGTVKLGGQSTYTGVTMIEFGVAGNPSNIELDVTNALPTTTDVMFAPVSGNSYQAIVDLHGNSQTVDSISYWAYNTAPSNEGLTNSVGGTVSTLTISGTGTPARPYAGILNDGLGQLALAKAGTNALILTGVNNGYTGGTTVGGGLLLLAPFTGGSNQFSAGIGGVTVTGGTLQGTAEIGFANNASLTVGPGGTVHPGLANIPSFVPSLALSSSWFPTQSPGTLNVSGSAGFSAGSNLIYDFGLSNQSLLSVGGVLGLPSSGAVILNINNLGGLGTSGSTLALMDYYGGLVNSFSSSQFVLGVHPSNYTFNIVANQNGTEIDLTSVYNGAASLVWSGNHGNVWDTNSTPNFTNNSSVSIMNSGDHVTFSDGATTGAVTISGSVSPASIVFSNSAEAYNLSGTGSIIGTAGLLVDGSGVVTLSNSANGNFFSGGTTVQSGKLVLDGAHTLLAGSPLVIGAMSQPGAVFQVPNSSAAGGNVAPVPEPGTIALLAVVAVAGIGIARRRRRVKLAK